MERISDFDGKRLWIYRYPRRTIRRAPTPPCPFHPTWQAAALAFDVGRRLVKQLPWSCRIDQQPAPGELAEQPLHSGWIQTMGLTLPGKRTAPVQATEQLQPGLPIAGFDHDRGPRPSYMKRILIRTVDRTDEQREAALGILPS